MSHQTVGSLRTGTVSEPPWAHTVSLPGPCQYLHGFSNASSWDVSPMHPSVGAEWPGFPMSVVGIWTLELGADRRQKGKQKRVPGWPQLGLSLPTWF